VTRSTRTTSAPRSTSRQPERSPRTSRYQAAARGKTTRRQRTGVWLLGTDDRVESTSLERHLIHLLDAIEPAAATLNALRSRDELRADFFCYWLSATGHGGPEVSPTTLARIAALDAALGIDFYGPFGDPD
jgi:Domain of unknown function (DUF4279)